MSSLVDYIKLLDGRGGITELRLLTQRVKEADTQHPIEFVLESHWLQQTATAEQTL